MKKATAPEENSRQAHNHSTTARAELERARQCFHEIVNDLLVADSVKLALIAAASSWAKAAVREVSR